LRLANGERLNHYSGISVYAQYAVVVPQSLVKIDKAVPLDIAALFGCAVVTGAGAVFNSAKVTPDALVAVIGLGGVGLTAVMAAREAGARKIFAIDVLPGKFDLARAVGATDCIDARDPDIVQQILDATDGGVDYTFEVSGNLKALELAQKITVRGGEVVGVGIGSSSALFNVAQVPWVCEERVLRGSFMGSGIPQVDVPRYAELYLRGHLPVDKLLSEHIAFEDLNTGFDRLHSGATVRQILLPHGTQS
jgi:alcohol dehydrogenase